MKNILVFPCGSEIGLEIHRSLKYSTHFRLIGASSIKDHGEFVYENYIDGIPFHDSPDFIDTLTHLIKTHKIDAVYPAMDAVAATIKRAEKSLDCIVIGSSTETTSICESKSKTYLALEGSVSLPIWHETLEDLIDYPVFIKPDVGYGSRNVHLAANKKSAIDFLDTQKTDRKFVFCENLPGDEYTIDCFSNSCGELLFCGARIRARVSNGISVNTKETSTHKDKFQEYAKAINDRLKPQGAWFFQMKEDRDGKPKLLEVAARLGGSSSLFRSKGVNFAMLSAFDAFNIKTSIDTNNYDSELDRALSNKYKIKIEYSTIYVDFDDCILLKSTLNHEIIGFIFKSISNGKKVKLITRHDGDLGECLKKYKISEIFDEIIHIKNKEKKSSFIEPHGAIFIDDSYIERMDVKKTHGMHVFSPDMVEALI